MSESDPKYHTIYVESPVNPAGATVLMDGQPVKGLRSVETRIGYDGATEVTLTLLANVNTEMDLS